MSQKNQSCRIYLDVLWFSSTTRTFIPRKIHDWVFWFPLFLRWFICLMPCDVCQNVIGRLSNRICDNWQSHLKRFYEATVSLAPICQYYTSNECQNIEIRGVIMANQTSLFSIRGWKFTNFAIFINYWQTNGTFGVWYRIHAWNGSIVRTCHQVSIIF